MQGFTVEETSGGVYLIAKKDGEKYLIQCKQWKIYKVGVKVFRELLGVMVGSAATGGFVVTSGEFTHDAMAFSKMKILSYFAIVILTRWAQRVEISQGVEKQEDWHQAALS